MTRREALRKMLLISVATCFTLFGAFEIISSISKAQSHDSPKATQTRTTAVESQTVSSSGTISSSTAAITSDSPALVGAPADYAIKVVYFGMTVQTTGTKEEYLTLPAPVFLQDVLSQIREEHVVLAAMLPTMAIVINGTPADGNPQLANNSEVDFIPTFAGG